MNKVKKVTKKNPSSKTPKVSTKKAVFSPKMTKMMQRGLDSRQLAKWGVK